MYIEIKGVQFVNKGAELMLHAVLQQLKVLQPDARIVLQSNANSPYVARAKVGAWQKAGLRFFGIEFNAYSHWLPKKVRNWLARQYGIVTEADIDLVLDASGFAYGEQWPEKNALYLADELERFQRKGKIYVFLPQAFGPFNRPLEQKRLKESLGYAALVCARDESSFAYLQQLMGPSERLCQLPDFTNLVEPAQLESQLPTNTLMMIPNHQMLSARNPDPLWRQNYLSVLRRFIDIAQQNAMHIVVLNHEGVKDLELCQQLLQGKSDKIELISEPDPLKVKALIGQSRAVVCSRFHGCVSALSQAIPCIGTSWSHKYEALFADYQSTELLIRPDLTEQQLKDVFMLMLNKDKTVLQQESAKYKKSSELLWSKVSHLLRTV
jgi:polysaccharide pyruvyl transferase WcaK-like protein